MMMKDNIIQIINEEIKSDFDYDFLNINQYNKEQENIELLNNFDLQKQFICDSLLNKKDKIKIISIEEGRLGGNWEGSDFKDTTYLSIIYHLKLEYLYDSNKEPIIFELYFDSDKINVNIEGNVDYGSYNREPYSETWFNYIDWNDIDVSLYDINENKINFKAYKNAPNNIKKLFLKEYLENFIESQTSSEIKSKIEKK